MMVLLMAVYLMPVKSKAMEKRVRITDLHKHCLLKEEEEEEEEGRRKKKKKKKKEEEGRRRRK